MKTPVLETTPPREDEFAEFIALMGERAREPSSQNDFADLDASGTWNGIPETKEVKP